MRLKTLQTEFSKNRIYEKMFLVNKNRKNKKGKKGDLILQFIIVIIISLIFIWILLRLGVNIFNLFTSGEEKQIIKSYETLYGAIDLKSKTISGSDSTHLTLYLPDKYQIVLFDKDPKWNPPDSTYDWGQKLYRPPKCKDASKPCLCLYRNTWIHADEGDITCRSFTNNFTVVDFEINEPNTYFKKDGTFFPIILAETYEIQNRKIYVWTDDDAGKKKEEDLGKRRCQTVPTTDVCAGKLDGAIVDDPKLYNQVYSQCQAQSNTFKSLTGTCVYSDTTKKCSLECRQSQIDCSKIARCEDYAKYYGEGDSQFSYFTSESQAYVLCSKTLDVCGVGKDKGCQTVAYPHLACNNPAQKTGEVSQNLNSPTCLAPSCVSSHITYYDNIFSYIAKTIDTGLCSDTDTQYQKFKTEFVNMPNIYVCKADSGSADQTTKDACKAIFADSTVCKTKSITGPQNDGFITYVDSSCMTKPSFTNNFAPIYSCQGPKINYEVSSMKLAAALTTATGPCKLTSTAGQYPAKYTCKTGTKITLITTIKNTGEISLKLQGVPKIMLDGVEASSAFGNEITIAPTASMTSTTSLGLVTTTNHKYQIFARAKCTETMCKDNPSIEFSQMQTSDGEIQITTN